MTQRLPVIGIPVDVKLLENAPYHIEGEKYVDAIVHGVDCYPVMLPAMSRGADLRAFDDKFPLSRIVGQLDGVFLHGQGIDRLGDGLVIEAVAPDGLIEAICVPDSPGFTLGVQWHPEWHFWEDQLSQQSDAAFARFQSR